MRAGPGQIPGRMNDAGNTSAGKGVYGPTGLLLSIQYVRLMDLDIRTVLRWLILGVLVLIGLSLLGVVVNIAGALLSVVLKAGVVILIVLVVIRVLEGLRG